MLSDKLSKWVTALGLAATLLVPQLAYSQAVEEDPSAVAMTADLLIARPLLLGATVLGTAVYVVSLPFSLAGGNAVESGKTLVVGPGEATFVRCLGCTRSGYKQDVVSFENE